MKAFLARTTLEKPVEIGTVVPHGSLPIHRVDFVASENRSDGARKLASCWDEPHSSYWARLGNVTSIWIGRTKDLRNYHYHLAVQDVESGDRML